MRLFRNDKNSLREVEKDSFKLEKDIQSLVEDNIEYVFGLEFVSTEFSVGGFRLDSLCFDEENNSFVIIEYKKGSSYSVVDQGYSYLSVMLNNKADFILEYNEKTNKQLKRDEINWSSSRVLFVAPSFNTYQKNSVNFKDLPFELWEIRKFQNDLIALEQYISSSTESIESVSGSTSNSVISTVSKEVRSSTESELTSVLKDELQNVWQSLKEKILDYPDTTTHTTRDYIAFRYENTALVYFFFRKNHIICEIRRGNTYPDGTKASKYFELDDPKGLSSVRTWKWKSGVQGSVYKFNIESETQVDYAMFMINQKYSYMSA
jgi:hypothetical protein